MDTNAVAEKIGIHPDTLRKWRRKGLVLVGGWPEWTDAEVEAAIAVKARLAAANPVKRDAVAGAPPPEPAEAPAPEPETKAEVVRAESVAGAIPKPGCCPLCGTRVEIADRGFVVVRRRPPTIFEDLLLFRSDFGWTVDLGQARTFTADEAKEAIGGLGAAEPSYALEYKVVKARAVAHAGVECAVGQA